MLVQRYVSIAFHIPSACRRFRFHLLPHPPLQTTNRLLTHHDVQVQEIVIDYTDCHSKATNEFTDIPGGKVDSTFSTESKPMWRRLNTTSTKIGKNETQCSIQFEIPTLNPPILLFYRLTNFYQNHRRYVKSVDERQLRGDAVTADQLKGSDACSPLITNSEGKPYYPCGLIANSLFNDTFSEPKLLNPSGSASSKSQKYVMKKSGIAWPSDKERFKKTKYKPEDVVPPPHWVERYPDGYTEKNMPDLSDWEELMVWMRTAGLPTFSKLAMRNDTDAMIKGTYQIDIIDRRSPMYSS